MKSVCLWVSVFLFAFCQVAFAQKTIQFEYYLSTYDDASLAFYKALQACREQKASKLVIPKSTYHCYPDKAFQKYLAISNNENGIKRIALPVIDQHNLEIDGQGSRIILHGVMMSSVIENSTNITIKNLEFDWDKPFYAQGKVIAVDPEEQSFDLKFTDEVEYRVVKNDILFKSHGREYMISKNFWFDPVNGFPVYNLIGITPKHWNTKGEQHYQIEDLGNHVIRVQNRIEPLPQPGWDFIAKWRNLEYRINRSAPGIHINQSSRILLSNVSVFSAAGMGIIGELSSDITLDSVKVVPTPDTDRVVSVTADATHFVNCRGKVVLKNCVLESQLDDGLNIHGNYAEVEGQRDQYTLTGRMMHRQQTGYAFAFPGDTLRLIDKKTLLPTGGHIMVRGIRHVNDQYFEIVAQEPLEGVLPEMGLDNISWTAQLEMTGCSVGKNWARSVLVKTPGKSVVSHNKFYSSMQGVRNWGDMIWFYESGNVNDVLISHNEFIDLCRVGAGFPVIVIRPQAKQPQTGSPEYYNHNIRITDNVIRTFDRGILYAFSVDGLAFENNTLVRTTTFEPLSPDLPVIEIENCKNVSIADNHYVGKPEADIAMDAGSRASGRVENNKGFRDKPENGH